jgi:hypothetical protein
MDTFALAFMLVVPINNSFWKVRQGENQHRLLAAKLKGIRFLWVSNLKSIALC